MAVLIAVAVTRAVEDDGSLELLRSCGLAPRQPLRSALGRGIDRLRAMVKSAGGDKERRAPQD